MRPMSRGDLERLFCAQRTSVSLSGTVTLDCIENPRVCASQVNERRTLARASLPSRSPQRGIVNEAPDRRGEGQRHHLGGRGAPTARG